MFQFCFRCKKSKNLKVKVTRPQSYEETGEANSGLQASYDYCQSPVSVTTGVYLEPRPATPVRDRTGMIQTTSEADELDTRLGYISLRSGSAHMYNNDTNDHLYCNTEFSNRISIKPPLPCKTVKAKHTYVNKL